MHSWIERWVVEMKICWSSIALSIGEREGMQRGGSGEGGSGWGLRLIVK